MRTVRLRTLAILSLVGLGQFCISMPARTEELQSKESNISIRRVMGAGFDFGWGIGSITYTDSTATIFERLYRSYKPQGMQCVLKEHLGPIVFHQQIDFTWDTYGEPNVDSVASLTRFSRSISLMCGTTVRFRRALEVQPLVGMGWTYNKTVAKPGTNPQLFGTRQTKLYSGFVAGGDILTSISSKTGIRLQYMHGFFSEPVNRLTLQLGALWKDDGDYHHMFAGIGVRAAWYAAHIREVIVMFDLGGSWPPD